MGTFSVGDEATPSLACTGAAGSRGLLFLPARVLSAEGGKPLPDFKTYCTATGIKTVALVERQMHR